MSKLIPQSKICKGPCKEEKRLIEFGKKIGNKDGKDSFCLICRRAYARQRYHEDPEPRKLKSLEYYHNTPEKQKEKGRKRYLTNGEEMCEKARIDYHENREQKLKYQAQYRQDNLEARQQYDREYNAQIPVEEVRQRGRDRASNLADTYIIQRLNGQAKGELTRENIPTEVIEMKRSMIKLSRILGKYPKRR